VSDRFPALGFDPAPGDPHEVRRCAREHGRAAAELDSLAVELVRLLEAAASWRGAAGCAFGGAVTPLAGQLRAAADAFAATAARLSAWAGELEDLQAQARVLERAASDALEQMRAAHARAAAAPPAGLALAMVSGAGWTVPGLADAEQELRQVCWRADELRAEWRAAGRQVAAAVDAANAAAPRLPRSFAEAVWERRDGIALAGDTAAMAALPAMAVPGVGPVIALGLGVVTTGSATALHAYADGPATDVALGAVGLGLGGAPITAARVLQRTPAPAFAARVGTRGLRAADVGMAAVSAALVGHKPGVAAPPDRAEARAGSRRALRQLLVRPVVAAPSRKR
jgi:hypothetical protein